MNVAFGMLEQKFKHELPYLSFDIAAEFAGAISGVVDGTQRFFNHSGSKSVQIYAV